MPGKKITDHQVQKYKQHRLKLTQVAAAAKVGICDRSARRIEHSEALTGQYQLICSGDTHAVTQQALS